MNCWIGARNAILIFSIVTSTLASGQSIALGEPVTSVDASGWDAISAVCCSVANRLIAQASLTYLVRSYTDHVVVNGSRQDASVLGNQFLFRSGLSDITSGFGFDFDGFLGIKLNGGIGAGDRVHTNVAGTGQNQVAWAAPGAWDIRYKWATKELKIGQLQFDNPLLVTSNNRALPVTFRGISFDFDMQKNENLHFGSVNAVLSHGMTYDTPITTAYSSVPIKQYSFIGLNDQYSEAGKFTGYLDIASNVWAQAYIDERIQSTFTSKNKLVFEFSSYYTHSNGAATDGQIDNLAYSLSASETLGENTFLVGFQQIISNQYFDYVGESGGDYLANSLDADYNAPHEKSVQFAHSFEYLAGSLKWKISEWVAYGWGANASYMAYQDNTPRSFQYNLYWVNGQPAHGENYEFAFIPSVIITSGELKGLSAKAYLMYHRASRSYATSSSAIFRIFIDIPISIF